jgi:hypothetical protein
MEAPLANTALEKQMLYRRDPRHTIAASAFAEHGSLSRPLSNTEVFITTIKEEQKRGAVDFLPLDYLVP